MAQGGLRPTTAPTLTRHCVVERGGGGGSTIGASIFHLYPRMYFNNSLFGLLIMPTDLHRSWSPGGRRFQRRMGIIYIVKDCLRDEMSDCFGMSARLERIMEAGWQAILHMRGQVRQICAINSCGNFIMNGTFLGSLLSANGAVTACKTILSSNQKMLLARHPVSLECHQPTLLR